MDDFYAEMQDVATQLLAEFNQGTVQLVRPGAQIPGANEWDAPTVTEPTIYPLNAVITGISSKFVNGDTILATDEMATVSVFDTDPQDGDILQVDGKPVTILQIERAAGAGDLPVVWTFIIRR